MSGSRRRTKVRWLRGSGEFDAHAFRHDQLTSECGLPFVNGMKPDNGPRCRNCKFVLSRDMRG